MRHEDGRQPAGDVVFLGGPVLTMDAARPRAESVADQRQPYRHSDSRGALNHTPDELADVVLRAHRDG